VLFSQSGVNLAALRTVKLSPALITWLFRKTCTTRRSSGLVSNLNPDLDPDPDPDLFPPRFSRPLPLRRRLEWSGRSHRPFSTRETQLASFVPYPPATRHSPAFRATGHELASFPASIPPLFALSDNIPVVNTTSNWLRSGAFVSPPVPSLRFH